MGTGLCFRGALFLAFLSGCASLAHELLWTRRLIDLLGASSASSTRVFSCFFLGLSLGAAVAPRLVRSVRRFWWAVGGAELAVAILAIPALTLPQWSGWIWPALGPQRLVGWEGAAVKLVLSAAIVFPPAFCMGLVLPLMAGAILRGQLVLARHGVWLYAANTLGGVLGLGAVTLVTLHWVGAGGSMLLAMVLNLLIAAGCFVLSTRCATADQAEPEGQPEAGNRWIMGLALAVASLSGMGILSFEVLALQLVALAAPLSFYAPAAVLMIVVLLLGLAALILPWLVARWRPERVVGIGLVGSAICLAAAPLYFFQLVQLVDLGPRESLVGYLAVLVGVSAVTLGPAAMFAGLVFPALLAWVGQLGVDRYGRRWGTLLAVNGAGGLVGAEVTYRWLLPALGVHQGIGSVAVLYAAAALGWSVASRRHRPVLLTGLVAAAVIATMLGPHSSLPQVNPSGVVIVDQRNGREGVVAVVDSPHMGRRIVMSNQYVLGGTKFRFDQERLTHLPLVLHPAPQRVACIGLATGITPGAALEHSAVQQVTAIELSPLVAEAADAYFLPFNHGITRHERATVAVEDARTYLAAARGEFDVVVGDLLLPWAAGEARLYSVEHFRSARDALREGGLFCQWLAAYQLTAQQMGMIRDTFCEVFPQCQVFRNSFDVRYPALALVGWRDGDLDWSIVRERCELLRRQGDVGDPLLRHVEGVAMLYLGPSHASGSPINTLGNMRLELAAGRGRVTQSGGGGYLYGEDWLHYVHEERLPSLMSLSSPPGQEHLDFGRLAQLGQRLSIWEAVQIDKGLHAQAAPSQLSAARQEILTDFPQALREDRDADWSRWPGDAGLLLSTEQDAFQGSPANDRVSE